MAAGFPLQAMHSAYWHRWGNEIEVLNCENWMGAKWSKKKETGTLKNHSNHWIQVACTPFPWLCFKNLYHIFFLLPRCALACSALTRPIKIANVSGTHFRHNITKTVVIELKCYKRKTHIRSRSMIPTNFCILTASQFSCYAFINGWWNGRKYGHLSSRNVKRIGTSSKQIKHTPRVACSICRTQKKTTRALRLRKKTRTNKCAMKWDSKRIKRMLKSLTNFNCSSLCFVDI